MYTDGIQNTNSAKIRYPNKIMPYRFNYVGQGLTFKRYQHVLTFFDANIFLRVGVIG